MQLDTPCVTTDPIHCFPIMSYIQESCFIIFFLISLWKHRGIPSRERINRNTKDKELMEILKFTWKNNYESRNRTKVWGNELSLCLFPIVFTEIRCLNQSYINSYNCDPGMYVKI